LAARARIIVGAPNMLLPRSRTLSVSKELRSALPPIKAQATEDVAHRHEEEERRIPDVKRTAGLERKLPRASAPRVPNYSRKIPHSIEKEEKIQQALTLRYRGYNYWQIAAKMGIKLTKVHQLVTDGLELTIREPPEMMLKLELDRLDRAHSALHARVMAGESRAIDRLLRISELRAKLLGLNAPGKLAVVPVKETKTADEMRAELSEVFQRLADAQQTQPEFGSWPTRVENTNPSEAADDATGPMSEKSPNESVSWPTRVEITSPSEAADDATAPSSEKSPSETDSWPTRVEHTSLSEAADDATAPSSEKSPNEGS
jgi:hypothetical protein